VCLNEVGHRFAPLLCRAARLLGRSRNRKRRLTHREPIDGARLESLRPAEPMTNARLRAAIRASSAASPIGASRWGRPGPRARARNRSWSSGSDWAARKVGSLGQYCTAFGPSVRLIVLVRRRDNPEALNALVATHHPGDVGHTSSRAPVACDDRQVPLAVAVAELDGHPAATDVAPSFFRDPSDCVFVGVKFFSKRKSIAIPPLAWSLRTRR
jgi:hypothetical protein